MLQSWCSIGKMNAFSFEMIDKVQLALDDCKDASAVIFTGNKKVLNSKNWRYLMHPVSPPPAPTRTPS